MNYSTGVTERSFCRKMASYWFTARPESVEHQHPFLVFDSQDRMHLPLTRFAKEARSRLDPKTVPTYLYALCPYFTWLDTNVWQVRMGQSWDSPPHRYGAPLTITSPRSYSARFSHSARAGSM